jgi:hypothetical protein
MPTSWVLLACKTIDFVRTLHNKLSIVQLSGDPILIEYEATMNRPYVTSIERSGIEKGLDRGLMAERALLRSLTQKRFGEDCAGRLERLLAAADAPEQLVEVGEWIIDCETGEALLKSVREWARGRKPDDR